MIRKRNHVGIHEFHHNKAKAQFYIRSQRASETKQGTRNSNDNGAEEGLNGKRPTAISKTRGGKAVGYGATCDAWCVL